MRRFIFISLLLIALAAILRYYYFLSLHQDSNVVTLYGNVDVRQVDLGFRVSGLVISMPFEEGDFVPAGTLVAELDKQPYGDQVAQAEAALLSVKTNLSYAEKVFQRRQELRNLGDGSVSEEDYENALNSRDVLLANLKQLKPP